MAHTTKVITQVLITVVLASINASSTKVLIRHKRAWIIDSFSIVEEYPGPFPYKLGTIELERSYRVLFHLTGKGVDQDPKGLLTINKDTGVIMVNRKVDYEEHNELKLTFEARNFTNKAVDTKLGVEIKILDINDNTPRFQKNVYEITVQESRPQGTFLLTVLATDYDKADSPNSTIDYRIVSVTPTTKNAEFFMGDNGKLSFKGCLDYEKAQKYTIVVEAKDRGEVVRLSSTCKVIVSIQDENNNFPTFIGQTRSGKVKERETLKSVLRTQVEDKDTKKTPAWRAIYTLHGDSGKNFHIETDPATNDGILSVVKSLDFEEGLVRNVTISVENEAPHFLCEVKERPTEGLWIVNYIDSSSGKGDIPKPQEQKISVVVEDVNDPPEFLYPVKDIMIEENTEIGHLLETFTAVDKDIIFVTDFVYVKGDDPENWVNVDPKTGRITTAKVIDRESKHVVNNTYKVIVYAVDNGEPPMTGTATLSIHLVDQNDNVPQLTINVLDMCLADGPSVANITAYDQDGDPYAGPFRFELLGDVKGQWRLDPDFGTTVKLVKENTVYSGFHDLVLKIFDMQGQSSTQNISVAVCDCSTTPNCRGRRMTTAAPGLGAIGIAFASLLLVLAMLLCSFTCEEEKHVSVYYLDSADTLLKSNTESPGTDCKVPDSQKTLMKEKLNEAIYTVIDGKTEALQQSRLKQDLCVSRRQDFSSRSMLNGYQYRNGTHQKWIMRSHSLKDHYKGNAWQGKYSSVRKQTFHENSMLSTLLTQKMSSIQGFTNELMDYTPHVYAEEGTLMTSTDLEAISIVEDEFDPNMLLYLGPRFNTLARLCKPEPAPRIMGITK